MLFTRSATTESDLSQASRYQQAGNKMFLYQAILAMAILTLASSKPCRKRGKDDIRVHYKARNSMPEAGELFSANQVVFIPPGTNTFDMMEIVADCNTELNFTFTTDAAHGAFIESIHGVFWSLEKELFWAFMKKDKNGLCLHNVGVSSHYPIDGENVIFSMEKFDVFTEIPNCVTGSTEPHD